MPSEFKRDDKVRFRVLTPDGYVTYLGVIDRQAASGYWWIIPDKLGFRMLLPEKDIKHEN